MIINLEQSERHLFMLSYKVAVFPRIQGEVPVFFHLQHGHSDSHTSSGVAPILSFSNVSLGTINIVYNLS